MGPHGMALRLVDGKMALPYFQSSLPELNLLQTKWRSELNPLLSEPILSGNLLKNITLVAAHSNVINTGLARTQQGWIITDLNASSTIYRSAPFNATTLTLITSADCIVNLWVF